MKKPARKRATPRQATAATAAAAEAQEHDALLAEAVAGRHCIGCRFYAKDYCAAPQLGHYAKLVGGQDVPGTNIPALLSRTNQFLCATEGHWFAALPDAKGVHARLEQR
jgi:hypothetical protein